MQARIQHNDLGITLTPIKKHGRPRPVGTVILSNVEITDGIATGDLVGEYVETYPLEDSELPGPLLKKMKPLSDDTLKAKIVYAAGRQMFYLPA